VLASSSRLLPNLVGKDERAAIQRVIALISEYTRNRDMIEIGAYRSGINAELDLAVRLMPRINQFLRQDMVDAVSREQSIAMLHSIAAEKVN
jgi:flagellum-specific ATP synthase